MFSTFRPVDYSNFDIRAACESVFAEREKVVKRTGKSWEELEEFLTERRHKLALRTTTASLIAIIQAVNSQKRNTFSESFVLQDMEANDAIISFEGGQIDWNDDYPGTVSYDPKTLKDLSSQDILKLKDIADSCGVCVRICGDADDALAEKLIQSGFEDYEDGFEYGDYRIPNDTTRSSKL